VSDPADYYHRDNLPEERQHGVQCFSGNSRSDFGYWREVNPDATPEQVVEFMEEQVKAGYASAFRVYLEGILWHDSESK
jgi:hypothetical protein